jgi:hypothetical protein
VTLGQPDPLAELRDLLAALSEEDLRAELERLAPVRQRKLEERLRPYRTPVTEATMRRGRG